MARNDDAFAGYKRRVLHQPLVYLGERPQRHTVKSRDGLQCIARTGKHRHAAIPQLDRSIPGNQIVKLRRSALDFRQPSRELSDLGKKLLVEGVLLVDIEVRNLLVLREIEARKVTLIQFCRLDAAAAE